MNKMILVSLFDKKADYFHPAYCIRNKALACRAFSDAIINRNDSDLSNHPEDFELFHVGSFDLDKGILEPISPVSICSGLDFIAKKESNNDDTSAQ